MGCTVVIGTQWGDEGKAKMIDYFTADSDIIVRYQGGANAGHTVVVNENKYIFHLVPSGILHEDKICVVGNGVVLDPVQLLEEIDLLESQGLDVRNRLIISSAAHLILPYHKAMDEAMEELRDKKIGTTHRGIGPCYSDKCMRTGVRAGDIFDRELLEERLSFALKVKNLQLEKVYGKETFKMEDILEVIDEFRERASDMIQDTQHYLHTAIDSGKNLLLEGAQGFALDIDHGTYPFVTSSNPTIGGALLGTGLNFNDVTDAVGIVKAYVTRVGEGPFPTEADEKDSDRLRVNGAEFGSTTGRPRRCGWFDVQLLKESCRLNGFNRLALTKLDVLTGFKKIKVAVAYRIDGEVVDYFPAVKLNRAEPVYEEIDGWDEDISRCKSFDEMPENAKKYVSYLEERVGVPVGVISVGPGRESTFIK